VVHHHPHVALLAVPRHLLRCHRCPPSLCLHGPGSTRGAAERLLRTGCRAVDPVTGAASRWVPGGFEEPRPILETRGLLPNSTPLPASERQSHTTGARRGRTHPAHLRSPPPLPWPSDRRRAVEMSHRMMLGEDAIGCRGGCLVCE
jgi:hypothetical protein